MKRNLFILPILLAVVCSTASAQNQTRSRRVTNPSDANLESQTPSGKEGNHVEKKSPSNEPASALQSGGDELITWGNAPSAGGNPASPKTPNRAVEIPQPVKFVERTSMSIDSAARAVGQPPANANRSNTAIPAPAPSLRATDEYRVGAGDVLDVRVMEMPTHESTLFTVLGGGAIEYPLLSAPIIVAGLTTDQIAARLQSEIKVISNPRLFVSVRDYASHAVIVTGWVDNPGRKMLRREAMPLFAVLAESLPRAEASMATIVRGQKEQQLALNDQKAMATLLLPGDLIKISGEAASTKKFVYVGGQVTSPGERDFRDGMTLTQAVLAGGGVLRDAAKTVKISRRNADGFLTATEYDLRVILDGKSPDPLVQSGDRIEVGRSVW